MEKSCCFDFDVARSTPGCDRLTCDGKHDPVFNILFDKSTNEYCYCLNRKQLEQYWDCVSKNREAICSKKCSVFDVFNKCMLCRQVADIWYELQKNFFFIQMKSSLLINLFSQLNGMLLLGQIIVNLKLK